MPPKKRPNKANSSGRASSSSQQSKISYASVPTVVPGASSITEHTETVTVVPEYITPTSADYNSYYANSDEEDAEDIPSFADILAQVKRMDYSISSPWMSRGPPPEPKFQAESQYALQQVSQPMFTDYKLLVPKQFSAETAPYFHELYFTFLQKFCDAGNYKYRAYCTRSEAGFRGVFFGSEENINNELAFMKEVFAQAFRLCIDPKSLKFAVGLTPTRNEVEQEFLPRLFKTGKFISALHRENELALQVTLGIVEPMIMSLLANGRSRNDIWMQMLPLLITECHTKEQNRTAQGLIAKFVKRSDDLVIVMEDFVDRMADKGLFTKGSFMNS